MCSAALPEGVSKDMALVILIINIFASGIGTMASACLGSKTNGSTIVIGILQFLLWPFLGGWIWAIIWSINLLEKANEAQKGAPVQPQQVIVVQSPVGQAPQQATTYMPAPPPGAYVPTPPPPGSAAAPPQYAPQPAAGAPPQGIYPPNVSAGLGKPGPPPTYSS